MDRLVHFSEPKIPMLRSGKGFYAVVRHADVVEISRNPKVFSSEPAVTSPPPPAWVKRVFGDSIVNMDDPRHARLRRIVSRAFSPKMLNDLTEDIQRAATRIVDDVLREGPRDFVEQVAARLPITVICDMMGIPEELREKVSPPRRRLHRLHRRPVQPRPRRSGWRRATCTRCSSCSAW